MSINSINKTTTNSLKSKPGSFMLVVLPLVLALASCNSLQQSQPEPHKTAADPKKMDASFNPLRAPKPTLPIESFIKEKDSLNDKTQIKSGPAVNIGSQIANTQAKELTIAAQGAPLSVNYHDMPLPAFINEVFGEQLGLSFNLDPKIEKQEDLVTLKVAEPIPPAELFHVAVRTLAAYGVAVAREGDLLTFTIDSNANSGEVPLLVSGRALPDVPASHRPIFMLVPLKAVTGGKVASWIKDALKGKEIEVQDEPQRNAVLLKGSQDMVAQALSLIEVLDQPLMRGKFSASIEPAFVKVADLSKNLESVLNAEGYDAKIKSNTGSIILIPLDGTNQMVVFAGSQAVLDHVREWINTLDRRQQMSIDQGIFTYEVRNAEAGHIVDLLNGIETGTMSGKSGSGSRSSSRKPSGSTVSDTVSTNTTASEGAIEGGSAKVSGGNFVVDTNRNTVIFKGSGQAWAELLPVIQSLDKSAPSVLVEVMIAEVTLTDAENTGMEFVANGSATHDGLNYKTKISTLGGLGIGNTGLTGAINSAGQTRAMLNLFQQNKRAEIRSRPRIMVKSGQQATIDVGTSVPTRGAASTSASASTFVVQSINNVKTGVRLSVKPIVHASGNIDIEIDQELSEASKTDTSSIDSPSIFNRQIKTVVSLRDGGSILLGGLISSSKSKTKSGVPKLASIPLLGRLFRNDSDSADRTELMIMIIPYVLDTPEEGQAIAKTIQDAFQQQ